MNAKIWQHPISKQWHIVNEKNEFLKLYPEQKFIANMFGVWSAHCKDDAERLCTHLRKKYNNN